jgi:hypothetical protein
VKIHRTVRTVAALGVVAALSAGVATAVVGADGTSNGTPEAATSSVRVGPQSPTTSTFVSVTPCRLVDTRRPGAGGFFADRATRSYRTQGNTTSQGGATNCGIPATATALELSVTAVTARDTGFLRLFPAGGSEPNATFMNYTPTFNASNAGTVAITPGTGANLKVRNYGAGTQVVIEVLGYYVENLYAVVNADGTLNRGSAGATAAKQSTGTYRVNFNRNISGCAFSGGLHDASQGFGTQGYLAMAANGDNINGVFVETFGTNSVKADRTFHVTVTC